MQLTKLRLSGFKSFVDATDLMIETGLTGVVGPNGCGKSNLVEALRWVMGESSYKNLRGSGMDDVIFSGSGNRPSRNIAEVTLGIDNTQRFAPAAFNDNDHLEVSRKIARESGSSYRINGKDVRARDVQLLFADAATGARSSALVRQGQIGEIIAAKPQARRRIIEDAAGIAGLHSRRHEAELRLKASETNLERLSDVIDQVGGQLDGLKRQARQAVKFKELSARIRRAEAIAFHLRWQAASEAVTDDERVRDEAVRLVAERTTAVSEANTENAIAAALLPDLRDSEAEAAARLVALTNARAALDTEEQRIAERTSELERLLEQIAADLAREENLDKDVGPILAKLDTEESELKTAEANAATAIESAKESRDNARQALETVEETLADRIHLAAEARAARTQREKLIAEETARGERLAEQLSAAEAERTELAPPETAALAALAADETRAEKALHAVEQTQTDANAALESAQSALAAAREARDDAAARRTALNAEADALDGVLKPANSDDASPILESIVADPGYETALGAALGDDLDHPNDPASPIFWAGADASDDPALPDGVPALLDHVKAPAALHRRLKQIGIVEETEGPALVKRLMPGQRLVTRDGALWRWDGLTARADAPTAAARRLAQRNRLETLRSDIVAVEVELAPLDAELAAAQTKVETAREQLTEAREAATTSRGTLDTAREALRKAERDQARTTARTSALDEAIARLGQSLMESRAARAAAEQANAPDNEDHDATLAACREAVEREREVLTERQAAVDGLARDADARQSRLKAIADERTAWQRRIASAQDQVARLSERQAAATTERAQLADKPSEIAEKRKTLSQEIETAEANRKTAADALAAAENRQRDCDRAERTAQSALSEAREARASAEARLEAAVARREDLAAQIVEVLDTEPHAVLALAGRELGEDLPALGDVEMELERLKRDRERLGGVNLRAEEEAQEVQSQYDAMVAEREDVEMAIRKLRGAIGNLNREGRTRLLEAFDTVNDHFKTLFTLLFGGGAAELQLIESDDPLEAGLEIVARPPGKKPQTLTLLSGGEQALTAIALIFAVFLTNPSPICVLDEVDAPLDDANVERYCDLLDKMAQTTTTRFLVITHNPITMARMDRLYGVTMAERGVSQLVSVDLETAERFREAV